MDNLFVIYFLPKAVLLNLALNRLAFTAHIPMVDQERWFKSILKSSSPSVSGALTVNTTAFTQRYCFSPCSLVVPPSPAPILSALQDKDDLLTALTPAQSLACPTQTSCGIQLIDVCKQL